VLIENEFTVVARADDLWTHLLDVERIAPCLPGAQLTETVDERTWRGTLTSSFGPVTMSFAGTVVMESRDDGAHRLVLKARGMERRGKGAAEATVTTWLEPGAGAGETTVRMHSRIVLTGAAAQLSRGLLPEISRKLTQRFADCLQASMTAAEAAPMARTVSGATLPTAAAPASVGGIRLGLSALWGLIAGFLRRLFRRSAPR
jgi:carbon monoxide dehydrogenase subunit G